MRLTASVAMAHSAVIGMKIPTRSPFLIPSWRRALARRLVSANISREAKRRTGAGPGSAVGGRVGGGAVLAQEGGEAALLDVLAGRLPDDLRRADGHGEPPGSGWA